MAEATGKVSVSRTPFQIWQKGKGEKGKGKKRKGKGEVGKGRRGKKRNICRRKIRTKSPSLKRK